MRVSNSCYYWTTLAVLIHSECKHYLRYTLNKLSMHLHNAQSCTQLWCMWWIMLKLIINIKIINKHMISLYMQWDSIRWRNYFLQNRDFLIWGHNNRYRPDIETWLNKVYYLTRHVSGLPKMNDFIDKRIILRTCTKFSTVIFKIDSWY